MKRVTQTAFLFFTLTLIACAKKDLVQTPRAPMIPLEAPAPEAPLSPPPGYEAAAPLTPLDVPALEIPAPVVPAPVVIAPEVSLPMAPPKVAMTPPPPPAPKTIPPIPVVPPAPSIIKTPREAPAAAIKALPAVKVTPLTTFSNAAASKSTDFRNTYTRLIVTSNLAVDPKGTASHSETNLLKYNERNALLRFLWGYKRDVNLTAKIKIGSYETVTPLITLSQQSNSEGQFWNRYISHQRMDFPLFLVKEDGGASIPDIRFRLAGSKDSSSNMVGTALQIAVTAIEQVAPETTVLTKLTEDSTKNTARAIDNAIGKLFNFGIAEEHITTCDLRSWDTKNGITLQLAVPVSEDSWDDALNAVGTWAITFDDPRPSIFSNWRICKNGSLCKPTKNQAIEEVYKDINAGQVLNYRLVKTGNDLGTIRSYILQQKWYVAAQAAFDGKLTTDKRIAENLCRDIFSDITSLDLNGEDANIVIWAVLKGMPENNLVHPDAFSTAPTCRAAMANFAPVPYAIDN